MCLPTSAEMPYYYACGEKCEGCESCLPPYTVSCPHMMAINMPPPYSEDATKLPSAPPRAKDMPPAYYPPQ